MATSIVEHGHKHVESVGSLEEATDKLAAMVQPGDLVMTLGAGDVWKVARDLAERIGSPRDAAAPDPDAATGNGN